MNSPTTMKPWLCFRSGKSFSSIVLWFGFLLTCNSGQDASGLGLVQRDIRPPVLLEQQSFGNYFEFRFDEPLQAASFGQIQPKLAFESVSVSGVTLRLHLKQRTIPGVPYLLRASVADANDNTLNFLARVYGINQNPARLLINELNPEGSKSSNSPEVVEFYVLEGGNIGGLAFVVGTLEENKGSFVFPSLDVVAGDFILLHMHWNPDNQHDILRLDETQSKDQAKGRLSSDSAWDFWADKISGLSDTNEALSLYESPQGNLMDAVIYSTSVSSPKYRGWKTSYLERQVDRLGALSAWLGSGDQLQPEDAIQSKDSTGTRSLSRLHNNGLPIDSDSAADWIIVPNRGYSFGTTNSLLRFGG